MVRGEKRVIVLFIYLAAMNVDEIIAKSFLLEDSSSDSSDTDSESDTDLSVSESDDRDDSVLAEIYAMPVNPLRNRDMPRMELYVKNIVPNMMERDFVSHFRLNRRTVKILGNMACSVNISRIHFIW